MPLHPKENLLAELGIAPDTRTNWGRTGVIPTPDSHGQYPAENYRQIRVSPTRFLPPHQTPPSPPANLFQPKKLQKR